MISHVQVLKSLLILKLWLSYGIRGSAMTFLLYFGVTSFWVAESKDLGAPMVLAAVPMRQTKRRTVAEAMQNQSLDDHGHTRREASQ
ncbi:Phenylalanine--tRNA ligase alpha subunit cytoplasmic [Zea mays]|jgi:hypothetical protein|uniref:Phenylalanine--tRNA ligase alpha subunit cytoplasmic n=1 Tax=Zea mays TaxID=4577 RepID=A0A1D6HL51_MAIZE|nr:Phenylalanine--tRNA ligase alpha subunit cytoplasmic [Zea mays]